MSPWRRSHVAMETQLDHHAGWGGPARVAKVRTVAWQTLGRAESRGARISCRDCGRPASIHPPALGHERVAPRTAVPMRRPRNPAHLAQPSGTCSRPPPLASSARVRRRRRQAAAGGIGSGACNVTKAERK